MVRPGARLLLLGPLVAVLVFRGAYGETWFNAMSVTRTAQTSDSVRIRALDGTSSSIEWGPGSASSPAGLRGVEYQYKTKEPYEWFLKFNLNNFAGQHVENAILRVSKCAGSTSCKNECTRARQCSCPTIFYDVRPDCGGGNIGESYDAAHDDLNVWHVPNDWDNKWKYTDWGQTWSGTTRDGVEAMGGAGGPAFTPGTSALPYSTYITGVQQVGETSSADLNVASTIGVKEQGANRWLVTGGEVSFRLTVNGTNSRFFVPESGDADYVPRLILDLTWTTTSTTTTSTSITTTTNTTITTCPSCTTTTVTTTTSTTSTTTSTTSTTTSTTSTTTTTTTTSTTTTSTTTSTTTTSTTTTTTTSTTTTSTTTSTTTTSTTTTSTTTTTTSTTSTSTTTTSTTSTTTSTTSTTTTTTTTSTTTTSTTTTSTTTTTTSTTTTSTTTSTAAAAGMSVSVTQVVALHLSQAADPTSVVSRASFQASYRSSVAFAQGQTVENIDVVSTSSQASARRLQASADATTFRVTVQYRVNVESLSQMNATITGVHSFSFLQVFREQLISAEQAVSGGFQISWIEFVDSSTDAAVAYSALQQNPNRTSQGGIFSIYGNPDWGQERFQTWAASAAEAVKIALMQILVAMAPSMSQGRRLQNTAVGDILVVSVGGIEVTSSMVHIRFEVFVQVPPLDITVDDPNGLLYQDRVDAFAIAMASLHNTSEFHDFFTTQLTAEALPLLPGMQYSPGSWATQQGAQPDAASGTVIAIILVVMILVFGTLYVIMRRRKVIRMARRLGHRLCPRWFSRAVSPVPSEEGVAFKHEQEGGSGLSPLKGKADDIADDSDTVLHFQEDGEVCHCGEKMHARFLDASFCKGCGSEADDIIRERWVESHTASELALSHAEKQTVLKGALNEFDHPSSPGAWPSSPGSSNGPGRVRGESFLDLVGGGVGGMFDIVKVAADLEAARREARKIDRNSPNKSNKHIHGSGAEVHPLRDQAWALRRAMGGEPHQHYIHHKKGPAPLSTRDLSLAASGNEEQPPSATALSGDLGSPSSRRMINAFRENSKYSALDVCSPQTRATTMTGGPSPLSVGRPYSPEAETNSTSGSEEMEIIEVTDSSDEESVTATRTSASNAAAPLPHLTTLRPMPKPK